MNKESNPLEFPEHPLRKIITEYLNSHPESGLNRYFKGEVKRYFDGMGHQERRDFIDFVCEREKNVPMSLLDDALMFEKKQRNQ